MSDQPYHDYRFRFPAADCAQIAPSLAGLRNMLGDPLDAAGNVTDGEPAFYGRRVDDEIYVAFRVTDEFAPLAGVVDTTDEESAAVLGVWA
jgi:hypothetical protein